MINIRYLLGVVRQFLLSFGDYFFFPKKIIECTSLVLLEVT